ncbi:hypothetical protein HAN_2g293 (nucleomorph) [Hemiselmis andersenii]|uniref:Uncharacterized protein n=1 Tax=Hemiselmis andersenii TaxID=464988 RepID=A9BKW0_HEMAN|nr:hypothetical protein HAN_2g293 [Hemiselmis andersenii]ABW98115.1 hypothetical protein HAN_2g293 [Hemiselmis andersenii]
MIETKFFFFEKIKLISKFINFFRLIINAKDLLIFEMGKKNRNLEIIIKIFYKELVNIFIFSKKIWKIFLEKIYSFPFFFLHSSNFFWQIFKFEKKIDFILVLHKNFLKKKKKLINFFEITEKTFLRCIFKFFTISLVLKLQKWFIGLLVKNNWGNFFLNQDKKSEIFLFKIKKNKIFFFLKTKEAKKIFFFRKLEKILKNQILMGGKKLNSLKSFIDFFAKPCLPILISKLKIGVFFWEILKSFKENSQKKIKKNFFRKKNKNFLSYKISKNKSNLSFIIGGYPKIKIHNLFLNFFQKITFFFCELEKIEIKTKNNVDFEVFLSPSFLRLKFFIEYKLLFWVNTLKIFFFYGKFFAIFQFFKFKFEKNDCLFSMMKILKKFFKVLKNLFFLEKKLENVLISIFKVFPFLYLFKIFIGKNPKKPFKKEEKNGIENLFFTYLDRNNFLKVLLLIQNEIEKKILNFLIIISGFKKFKAFFHFFNFNFWFSEKYRF